MVNFDIATAEADSGGVYHAYHRSLTTGMVVWKPIQ